MALAKAAKLSGLGAALGSVMMRICGLSSMVCKVAELVNSDAATSSVVVVTWLIAGVVTTEVVAFGVKGAPCIKLSSRASVSVGLFLFDAPLLRGRA